MISRPLCRNIITLLPTRTTRQLPVCMLRSDSTSLMSSSAAATYSKAPFLEPFFNIHKQRSSIVTHSKSSPSLPVIFTTNNLVYCNRQQVRFWNESMRHPVHVAMEEEARKREEFEKQDDVGRRLRAIALEPGDGQTIWANLFLDGKLVNGTQITIPRYDATIDTIKYAVKERCSEILTDIAALTFQVLPTRHKRKKSRRKLTRKNRILKSDVLYDMALHGGESEVAGIIVKAHTRKMQEGDHFTYGERAALEFGIDFVKAIMQDYKDGTNNDGTKILLDVPDLECGMVKNVVLRPNITEPFWNRVYELAEGSTVSHTHHESSVMETDSQRNGIILEHKILRVDETAEDSTVSNTQSPDETIDPEISCVDEIAERSTESRTEHDELYEEETSDDSIEPIDNNEQQRYRVCVVGSCGVGKTTTTAVLIRLLLTQGKSVVYHCRTADKSRWIYEFIPNKTDVEHNPYNVEVKVIAEKHFNIALTPTLVDDIRNYYIVDPGSTTFDKNCCPDDQVQCRVVLITSPDDRQWGGSEFTKLRGGNTSGTFLYYPTWTISELRASFTSMTRPSNTAVTNDTILERYREVGGIPGHVLAPSHSYRDIVTTQSDIIATLTEQHLKLMSQNYWKHLGRYNAIVGYSRATVESESFVDPIALPISTKAFESICLAHKRWFWNQLQLNNMDNQFASKMFAVLCRDVMKNEAMYKTIYRDIRHDSTESTISSDIALGGCGRIESCNADIMAAATETENVVFYSPSSSSSGTNLADFVYRKGDNFYAFRSCAERDSQVNWNDVQKLTSSTGRRSLHLYHFVPSFNFDTFITTLQPDRESETCDKVVLRVLCFKDDQ